MQIVNFTEAMLPSDQALVNCAIRIRVFHQMNQWNRCLKIMLNATYSVRKLLTGFMSEALMAW